MNLTVPITTHELTCQFHIPNFGPVTYIYVCVCIPCKSTDKNN